MSDQSYQGDEQSPQPAKQPVGRPAEQPGGNAPERGRSGGSKPPPPIPELLQRPVEHSSLKPKPPSLTASAIGDMGQGLAIALDFLFVGIAGGAAGWLIDNWLGSSPLALVIGLSLGLVAGTFRLVHRLEQDDRQAQTRAGTQQSTRGSKQQAASEAESTRDRGAP